MPADVVNLVNHRCAMSMALVSYPPEVRDHFITFGKKVPSGKHAGPVRGNRLNNNHGSSAPGALTVVPEVPVSRQTFIAHVDRMRSEHDAAREFSMPQFERC